MSYGKEKTTVEEYYKDSFPRLLNREQRKLGFTNGRYAEHLGISVESLEDYYNKGTLPGSATLIKIMSKLTVDFLADIIAAAGLHDRYSIISNDTMAENKQLKV